MAGCKRAPQPDSVLTSGPLTLHTHIRSPFPMIFADKVSDLHHCAFSFGSRAIQPDKQHQLRGVDVQPLYTRQYLTPPDYY